MTDGEVPQVTFCDRLMAQPFSGMEVSWLSDNLPYAVLLEALPQVLQPCQISGNSETLRYPLRIVPSIPMLLTPGTAIHHACQRHVELFVHPTIIFSQDFTFHNWSTKTKISALFFTEAFPYKKIYGL